MFYYLKNNFISYCVFNKTIIKKMHTEISCIKIYQRKHDNMSKSEFIAYKTIK